MRCNSCKWCIEKDTELVSGRCSNPNTPRNALGDYPLVMLYYPSCANYDFDESIKIEKERKPRQSGRELGKQAATQTKRGRKPKQTN